MALTSAAFLVRFPEFTSADTALVDAKLAEALRRTPEDVWGDVADDAQGYRAAHLLATSPFGRDARMVNKDGTTTYSAELDRMIAEAGPANAPRVT